MTDHLPVRHGTQRSTDPASSSPTSAVAFKSSLLARNTFQLFSPPPCFSSPTRLHSFANSATVSSQITTPVYMLVKKERRQRLQYQTPDAGTSSHVTKENIINTPIKLRSKVPRRIRREEMASVPYMAMHTAAGAGKKKRQNTTTAEPGPSFASVANSDGLMQYSSKMMNSIWGMYNKYSVHNLKSLQGGSGVQAEGQAEGMASVPDSGAAMAKIGTLSYAMASTMWESANHY